MEENISTPRTSGKRVRNQGIALSVGSQVLWGTAGNVIQYIFLTTSITVAWIIGFRLILAGLILLAFTWMKNDLNYVMAVWHSARSVTILLIFSVFAMLGIQLTYFMAIKYSNAATATVLQFTSPVLIIVYLAIKNNHLPSRLDVWTVLLAVIGTFLLITQGNLQKLSVPLIALIWGILLACANSLYIILPAKLLETYGTMPIVAWSFLIGGVIMNFVQPMWVGFPEFSWKMFWILFFLVVPATTFAYFMELQSITMLRPVTISILQAAEPISATLVAVIFMGVSFNWIGIIGIIMIISTVFLDAIPYKKSNKLSKH